MKVTGFTRNDFDVKDGGSTKRITGYNVYLSNEIAPDSGKGFITERVYLTDDRLKAKNINLAELLNAECRAYYNRYGKIDTIVPVK